MKHNLFIFLSSFVIFALAGNNKIFFPDGKAISLPSDGKKEFLQTLYSRYTISELQEKFPQLRNTFDLSKFILSSGELHVRIYGRVPCVFRMSEFGYYYKIRDPSQKWFSFRIQHPNHSAFLKIDSTRDCAIRVHSFVRRATMFTSLNQITHCLVGPFEMTLPVFCDQKEHLPSHQIRENLNDIRLLLNEFKGTEYEGTEIIQLERVIVVCRDRLTGKFELKILIHGLIGADIGKLIEKFEYFCSDILSGMETVNSEEGTLINESSSDECTVITEIYSEAGTQIAEIYSEIDSLIAKVNASEIEQPTPSMQSTTENIPSSNSELQCSKDNVFMPEVPPLSTAESLDEDIPSELDFPPVDLDFWEQITQENSALFDQMPLLDLELPFTGQDCVIPNQSANTTELPTLKRPPESHSGSLNAKKRSIFRRK